MRHNSSSGSRLHALIQHACVGGSVAWHTFGIGSAVAMVYVMYLTLRVVAWYYCLS